MSFSFDGMMINIKNSVIPAIRAETAKRNMLWIIGAVVAAGIIFLFLRRK